MTPGGCEDLAKLNEATGDATDNASDGDDTALDLTDNSSDSEDTALYTSEEVVAKKQTSTVANHEVWITSCIQNYCSKAQPQPQQADHLAAIEAKWKDLGHVIHKATDMYEL
ncbi:hypothetical protein CROQUDRAFT_100659 [Cronartium quercuum f. sp. fusiforme G11]|uniref:Uncharacterized protein n=1 Tax=Cronartium quercuum f. sp. fusiforme G11 TaxID=708437 RepID=A0A9P6N9S6_9BASI|nr:hypothetical protein CROQUDRAFT_100659 [Cronartium quercuum f. sp. fusiforme G11]